MKQALFTSILLLCCIRTDASGQSGTDSLKTYQYVSLSGIFGGQVHNNNFLYNSGFAWQASFGFRVNRSLQIGLGVGQQMLKTERFVPLYFETIGFLRDQVNTPFIRMQAGYSIGWNTGIADVDDYSYRGGIFFDAGLGRRIPAGRGLSLFLGFSYRHQFAMMEYTIYNSRSFRQVLNFDMLIFSLGLQYARSE